MWALIKTLNAKLYVLPPSITVCIINSSEVDLLPPVLAADESCVHLDELQSLFYCSLPGVLWIEISYNIMQMDA